MHVSPVTTFLFLLGTVVPLTNAHIHPSVLTNGVTASTQHPQPIRPSLVENGADVIVHPLPFNSYGGDVFQSSNVAITPDGSVYFPDKQGNAVDRIDPSGAFSQFPAAHASNSSIYYLHGVLWIPAYPTGVVKIDIDGSRHHWYPLNVANVSGYVVGIAALSNATYLAIDSNTSTCVIERIDARGFMQTTNVPYFLKGLTAGRDGNLYFSYDTINPTVGGIGRLSPDGLITYFPAPNGAEQLVYSNGSLYVMRYYETLSGSNSQLVDFYKMNATTGAVTEIGLPNSPLDATPGSLSVDDGGNIWMGVETDTYHNTFNLYQYDIYNGKFTGPVEPGIIRLESGNVQVGPDDNIYAGIYTTSNAGALAVYVRHVQTLEPTELTITATLPMTFSILETHYNGPWTAQSLSPSVVGVSPALSTSGKFTATEASHGSARILVKDRLGNVSFETVNAQ